MDPVLGKDPPPPVGFAGRPSSGRPASFRRSRPWLGASLGIAGAGILAAPSRPQVCSILGFTLPLAKRDFRVFDNFADPTANADTVREPQFPGRAGAVRAVWKAAVEWNSRQHGDGGGDPCQPFGLGGASAPLDFHFQGSTNTPGGVGSNITSGTGTGTLGPGVLAVTYPTAGGWQILFDDAQWTWQGRSACACVGWDIQGVATHELGHALGLGHSSVASATMFAGVSFCALPWRSIEVADVQCLVAAYGSTGGAKPILAAGTAAGGAYSGRVGEPLALAGSNLAPAGNEVWFTRSDPAGGVVKATNVPSSAGGTRMVATIPADAADGDVLVVVPPGTLGDHMSNPQPIHAAPALLPAPPSVTSASPNPIAIFSAPPQTLTLAGTGFSNATQVQVGSVVLASGAFTIVNATTIAFAMPIVATLGANGVTVTNANGTSPPFALTVIPVATPTLDTGNLFGGAGLAFTIDMWGQPGNLEVPCVSTQSLPSAIPGIVSLGIGNNFTDLTVLPAVLASAAQGRAQLGPLTIPGGLAGTLFYFQQVEVPPSLTAPFASSAVTSKWILF